MVNVGNQPDWQEQGDDEDQRTPGNNFPGRLTPAVHIALVQKETHQQRQSNKRADLIVTEIVQGVIIQSKLKFDYKPAEESL